MLECQSRRRCIAARCAAAIASEPFTCSEPGTPCSIGTVVPPKLDGFGRCSMDANADGTSGIGNVAPPWSPAWPELLVPLSPPLAGSGGRVVERVCEACSVGCAGLSCANSCALKPLASFRVGASLDMIPAWVGRCVCSRAHARPNQCTPGKATPPSPRQSRGATACHPEPRIFVAVRHWGFRDAVD